MSVMKIDDASLYRQERFHVNQSDVPNKSAAEMKEFMDYIPRRVIIPKVNELADAVNCAATEDSVYKKSEAYNKNETDTLLALKADADSVYTEAQTDTLLAQKLDTDSDRIIKNVTQRPTEENTALLCREGCEIKLYKNSCTAAPCEGDPADSVLSPALCVYATADELNAAIDAHGLTDTTANGTACIHLLDLYTQGGVLIDKLYIIKQRTIYAVSNKDAAVSQRFWYMQSWVQGTADICEYFAQHGYTDTVMRNISEFAENVFRKRTDVYSAVSTQNETEKKLASQDPSFTGTLSSKRSSASDGTSLISFTVRCGDTDKSFTVKPVIINGSVAQLEIGGTVPVVFGDNVVLGGVGGCADSVENLGLVPGQEFVCGGINGAQSEGGISLGIGSQGSRSYIKLWDSGVYRYLYAENGQLALTDTMPS